MIFWNSFRRAIQWYQQCQARLDGNFIKDQNVLPTLPDFGQLPFQYGSTWGKNFQIRWLCIPRAISWYITRSIACLCRREINKKSGVYLRIANFWIGHGCRKTPISRQGRIVETWDKSYSIQDKILHRIHVIWSRNNFEIFFLGWISIGQPLKPDLCRKTWFMPPLLIWN